ncbi:HAD family hydrolase [Thioalkalivibrio sp. HK1]|uniref:HAD family hydrolase n=1 Tax=Thioalkalivibrio sp. HK1 TaxID=1469245 RepID=UPI000570197F|nr:HAD family hydrolase [Thioalkalivibrio sp. HK1]
MPAKLAMVYDFDGTLIDGIMSDSIVEGLGLDPKTFWEGCSDYAHRHGMDKICSYMFLLLRQAKSKNKPLTLESMQEVGRGLELRAGLEGDDSWFERINGLCKDARASVEHYVVTSGLAEIVEANPIVGEGRIARVFGSRFHYDEDGAQWPAKVVNYTTKTQYLFRINKGALDEGDEDEPNRYMPPEKRPIPFENMIFIGDGFTDIPCFSLVKANKGHAFAVLGADDDKSKKTIERLVADKRVDGISLKDHFKPDGILFKSIGRIVERIGARG